MVQITEDTNVTMEGLGLADKNQGRTKLITGSVSGSSDYGDGLLYSKIGKEVHIIMNENDTVACGSVRTA